jgi:hypothetical protein
MRFVRRGGDEVSHVQLVAFNRTNWSESEAESWMLNRDLATDGGSTAEDWLLYPQGEKDETRYDYRDLVLSRVGGLPDVRVVIGVPNGRAMQLGRRR